MTRPTTNEIRDQILADIQSGFGLSDPLPPRSVWGVLATALAGALSLVYRFAQWARNQIFTQTADREQLLKRGREYGLSPIPAQEWRGTVEATGSGVITAGTLYTAGDYVYEVTLSETISGTTSVEVRALDAGSAANLSAGDTVELSSPLAGVDREATVASTTQTGEDAESTELFRARLLQRQQNQPQGGAIPDYIVWATEVPGIAEAHVVQPSPGFVNVYPLTDDPAPANRIPSGAKLTEVTAYLQDPRRKPLNSTVNALAATELDFDVDIADLIPNTVTVKTAVESAIESYMYERRPRQYSNEPDARDVVSAALLTKIAIDAGADVATVTLKNAGGSTITDYELQGGELARLRTLTWI